MAISAKTREEVMKRDNGECMFWHNQPVPATEISHKDHQGVGGLPPEHPKNQPPTLAASCGACHRRFHQGRIYVWEEFEPAFYSCVDNIEVYSRGVMKIRAPNGRQVKEADLWFYNRRLWAEAKGHAQSLANMIRQERLAAWRVAETLAWFKKTGMAPALENECADVLDVGALYSLSSAEVKQRVRMCEFRMNLDAEADGVMGTLDIGVADRLRKVQTKEELIEIGGWFADLPPAEAWSKFNERYPGKESMKKFRVFTGHYREVEAETDKEAEKKIGAHDEDKIIVVKGGSVIRGTRQEKEE